MAKAVGVHGIRVEDPGDQKAALVEALVHDGPVLIDMVTNRIELAMPPKATLEQAKGFGIYPAEAIMNHRGDEVVELAHTNVWR